MIDGATIDKIEDPDMYTPTEAERYSWKYGATNGPTSVTGIPAEVPATIYSVESGCIQHRLPPTPELLPRSSPRVSVSCHTVVE